MGSVYTKCYMCDAKAVGKEHVPPRCLFPKQKDLALGEDLRKELLTVPSCNLHNSEKSGDDEYFLNVLTGIVGINEVGRQHYKKQIRRRNSKNPSIIRRFANRSIEINGQLAFEVEIERLDVFIEHLACALYMAHFKSRWHGDVEWLPEFLVQIQSNDKEQEKIKVVKGIDSEFSKIEIHGTNKRVFMYQVVESDELIKMRLYFYDNCKILLIFPNKI